MLLARSNEFELSELRSKLLRFCLMVGLSLMTFCWVFLKVGFNAKVFSDDFSRFISWFPAQLFLWALYDFTNRAFHSIEVTCVFVVSEVWLKLKIISACALCLCVSENKFIIMWLKVVYKANK